MEKHLRIAAALLTLGLVVEGLSLCWNTAASFLLFVMFGGILFAGGLLLYIRFLIARPAAEPRAASR